MNEKTFTFAVTVTVPPGGSEDAGDYAVPLAEATSALGFDVGAFELVLTDYEPTVTVEGKTYYTVHGDPVCPECGAMRSTERIADHMASEHDSDRDDDGYDDGDTLVAGVLYGPDGYEAEDGDFPAQGGGCRTRTGHFTGQAVCTACGPDCEHYLCTHEDEINHDTVQEQTGEDA